MRCVASQSGMGSLVYTSCLAITYPIGSQCLCIQLFYPHAVYNCASIFANAGLYASGVGWGESWSSFPPSRLQDSWNSEPNCSKAVYGLSVSQKHYFLRFCHIWLTSILLWCHWQVIKFIRKYEPPFENHAYGLEMISHHIIHSECRRFWHLPCFGSVVGRTGYNKKGSLLKTVWENSFWRGALICITVPLASQ